MWKSQLRIYKDCVERDQNIQGSPRKPTKILPKAEYSLYSSTSSNDRPNGMLDGCSRLLTEILEQDKGAAPHAHLVQGETYEHPADNMRKMVKPVTSAGARTTLKDRKTGKVVSTKKTLTPTSKNARGRISMETQRNRHRSRATTLSETDDSLRSRSDGHPVPLNSSEKITQANAVSQFYARNRLIGTDISIEGASKTKRKDVSVGLMPPYNNRIPSSTPNLTPTKDSEKQKLLNQLLRGVVSKPPEPAAPQHAHYEFEWPVKENAVCADRRPAVTYAATSSSHGAKQISNTNTQPSQLGNSAAANIAHPASVHVSNPPHLSTHSAQRDGPNQAMPVGYVPYYRPLTEHIREAGMSLDNPATNLAYQVTPGGVVQHYVAMQPGSHLQPTSMPPGGSAQFYVVPSGGYIQPHVGEPITTTAGIYPTNIRHDLPHTAPTTITDSKLSAAPHLVDAPNTYEEYLAFRAMLDREEQETNAKLIEARERASKKSSENVPLADLQQIPTRECETDMKKPPARASLETPQHSTPEKEKVYLVNTAVNTSDDGTQSCTTTQTTTSSKQSESSTSSAKKKHVEEDKSNKVVKNSGGKKKKKGKGNKVGVHTLRYLLRELQSVPGVTDDKEVVRITRDLDDAISNLLPSLSDLDWQTEIDLAIQPLRSENAQLRRRLRILNQQVKNKENSTDGTSSDQNFDLVHLQMLNHTLERQVKEEKTNKDQLQQQIFKLMAEVEELSRDKKAFIQLIGSKEDDHLKSQQDRVNDITKLRNELDLKILEAASLRKKNTQLEQEIVTVKLSSDGKDTEIARLQQLVRSLQTSMQQLLSDLRTSEPQPLHHWGSAMDHLQNACRLLDHEHTLISSEATPNISPQDPKSVAPVPVASPKVTSHAAADYVDGSNQVLASSRELKQPDSRLPQIKEGATLETSGGVRPLTADSLHQMESQHKHAPVAQNTRVGAYLQSNRAPSAGSRNSLDSTQYLSPPAGSQGDELTPRSDAKIESGRKITFDEPINSARSNDQSFTVKDFLTGLADKFREENLKHHSPASESTNLLSKQDGKIHYDKAASRMDDGKNHLKEVEDEGDGDSTLIEQPLDGSLHEPNQSHFSASVADQSRFSVTDYFKKYPAPQTSGTGAAKYSGKTHDSILEEDHTLPSSHDLSLPQRKEHLNPRKSRDIPSRDDRDFSLKDQYDSHRRAPPIGAHSRAAPYLTGHSPDTQTYPKQAWEPERTIPSNELERNESGSTDHSTRSLQEQLYKGTELDTSISTIQDMESVVSSVSSISSLSSFNDQAFQQGLASLDENIARIQKSLKQSALKI